MPAKPKFAAKKETTGARKSDVEKDEEELEELDADEMELIFPSTPYQALNLKFAEN